MVFEVGQVFESADGVFPDGVADWCNENNPCTNCKINKKDHWDDVHYNCAENHYMRCPILKEYHNNRDTMYNEYAERKREESKNADTY